MKLKRGLIIPDCHAPYVDKVAWRVLLAAGRALKPDFIVILGDFGDFYSVSNHSKDPRRVMLLDEEIRCVNERLSELDALGAKEKHFIEGNHENRLQRYLDDHAPALKGLLTVRDQFKLKERGWSFTPYKDFLSLGKISFTHDVGKAGKYAHYDAQMAFEGNVVIGHTHRLGYTVVGNVRGKPHLGAMLGWLGDFEEVDYMHRARARRDWVHGFGIAYMEPNGNVHVTPVPIVNGSVIVEGKLVRAS